MILSVLSIVLTVAVLLLLGIIIFPVINRNQLKKMPYDQQIRILMKEAKGLIYFKNISNGTKGALVYIKNKRKILYYPWVLVEDKMICTKKKPYTNWDYPEEHPKFSEEEIKQAKEALVEYNKNKQIKLYLQNEEE